MKDGEPYGIIRSSIRFSINVFSTLERDNGIFMSIDTGNETINYEKVLVNERSITGKGV